MLLVPWRSRRGWSSVTLKRLDEGLKRDQEGGRGEGPVRKKGHLDQRVRGEEEERRGGLDPARSPFLEGV